MEQEDKHFNKLYWFCVAVTACAIVFDFCMVFVPIPKANEKYADVLLGSLNTGALMAGIQFLLGGNAIQKKNQPTVNVTGDTPTVINPTAPYQSDSEQGTSKPPQTGGTTQFRG